MTAPWFHAPELPRPGDATSLDGREARHAAGARRLRVGSSLVLFDGHGRWAEAEIVDDAGGAIVARVGPHQVQPPPSPRVHLATALPRGDRQATLLSMAAQLGMTAFTPLDCARSVARASAGFAARAGRIVVEACKQSRRAHVPAIHDAAAPAAATAAARGQGDLVLVAHPGGSPLGAAAPPCDGPHPAEIRLFVGPEGGFAPDEIDAIEAAGGRSVDLGPAVLRIETAAVAALAAIMIGFPGRPDAPRPPSAE